jgi:hypothetical protein
MRKGIVMEITDHYLTLLTPDGQFLQAKKQKHPYTLGEEILFSPISQKKFLTRFAGIKQLSIAAAVVFIILGSMIPFYQNNKAYAYVSIDVNPSIELGINKQMEVVKLTAFNSDGKKIISHIGNWEKESMIALTQEVLEEMKKEGYLTNHHTMVISTVHTEAPEKKTDEQLTKNLSKMKVLAKESDLKVTVLNGTKQDMEKAHQLGITTGKYKEAEIQSLKKHQPTKKIEDNGSENQSNINPPVIQEQAENVKPAVPAQQHQSNAMENKAASGQTAPGAPGQTAPGHTGSRQTPPGQFKKEEIEQEHGRQYETDTNSMVKAAPNHSDINKNNINNQLYEVHHK